ncbi:hypothetical protein [Catellatospora sp. NPDC049133]|uniref:hypothetical protein n=1 Tax=Catellatospora sp. NPDC049133 TaxID=3155499 RepID=UPI0033CBC6C1
MTGPFSPDDVALASYTFLSHVRTGLAAAAGDPAAGALRTTVQVSVPVLADGAAAGEVSRRLELYGPGDVLAIDERQVLRRYPAAGAVGVEPNYLAHVEFDRPDLPWLFTPRAPEAAGTRLAPWLALVVLEDGRYRPQPSRPGFVPVVRARLSELQPLDGAWAFAHGQVLGPPDSGPSLADRLTEAYRPVNLSRLMCPRRLRPGRGHLACVVPATDAGARAALGQQQKPGWSLGPAWTRRPGDDDQETDLPVLHSWWFSTGAEGDFEALAARLRPLRAAWQIERLVDTSRPWLDAEVAAGRRQPVAGPLIAPWGSAAAEGWPAAVTGQLRARLNLPADHADRAPSPDDPPLPLVGPPIYGGAHTGRRRISPDDGDWLAELNLRPDHRIAAGLGGRVVQHDQEALMQAAWTQLGDLAGVNAMLRHAQLARFTGASVYRRHLDPLPLGELLQVTRPVHGEVSADAVDDRTLRESVAASSLPDAVSTTVFRRVTSRYGAELALTEEQLQRGFQRPYDDGWLSRVSPAAAAAISPAAVQQATGQPGAGPEDLLALAQAVEQTPTVTDAVVAAVALPASEPEVYPQFAVDAWAARRNLDVVLAALPADPAADPDRAAALLGPLGALAKAADGDTGRLAAQTLLNTADLLGRGPEPAAVAAKATEPDSGLTPQTLAQAILADSDVLPALLDTAQLAALARVCVDPPLLTQAAKDDPQVLVAAAHEELDLAAYAAAAVELAGSGRTGVIGEVVVEIPQTEVAGTDLPVPVGTGTDLTVPEPVTELIEREFDPGPIHLVDEQLAADDPGFAPDLVGDLGDLGGVPGGEFGGDLGGEPGGEFGGDLGGELPGGELPGGVKVPGRTEAEILEGLGFTPEQLELLAGGQPPEELLAELALGCLDDDQLAEAARLHLEDPVLAELLRPGLGEPGADLLAHGCFEEPQFVPDQRIVEAILAWLGRERLPSGELPDLCGLDEDMSYFIDNYLRIHQPLPTVAPSPEAVARLRALFADLVSLTWPGTPVRDPLAVDRGHLLAQLDPAVTVPQRVRDRLGELPDWVPAGWFDDGMVRPVQATPVFERPMYQALLDSDASWLLPGLDRVPEPDLVTVVASNPRFVEAFLTGLNHEMSRELLWRGYPADPRGVGFRRFWSADGDELTAGPATGGPLGSHLTGGLDDMLVLVVRGELVRRHPDLMVTALRSDGVDAAGRPVFGGRGDVAAVVFAEHRVPDTLLVGFRITAEQVRAAAGGPQRWWFLLAEHPTAPRFGLDVSADAPDPASRDELAWNHFTLAGGAFLQPSPDSGPAALGWGGTAADTAHLLLQDPVRAVFDAWDLIAPALDRS